MRYIIVNSNVTLIYIDWNDKKKQSIVIMKKNNK